MNGSTDPTTDSIMLLIARCSMRNDDRTKQYIFLFAPFFAFRRSLSLAGHIYALGEGVLQLTVQMKWESILRFANTNQNDIVLALPCPSVRPNALRME